MVAEGGGPSPGKGDRIQQLGRGIAAEQHQRHHPEGVQIHPGLWRSPPGQLGRGIARRGAGLATHQPEIEQHRQTVTVAAQQIGRAKIPMHQLLAMERSHHRQHLPQQQQHFPRPKHQLALSAGLEQLLVGAAHLPLPHQPQLIALGERSPQPRHLGMEHPLQAAPKLAGLVLILVGPELPQGYRGITGQLVAGAPERALRTFAQALLQAIAIADHCTRCWSHQPASTKERWGCLSPLLASQSPS